MTTPEHDMSDRQRLDLIEAQLGALVVQTAANAVAIEKNAVLANQLLLLQSGDRERMDKLEAFIESVAKTARDALSFATRHVDDPNPHHKP